MQQLSIRLFTQLTCCLAVFLSFCQGQPPNDWIELFNGKDLSGWEANENIESFFVEDGKIIANGERSHLFYMGESDTMPVFTNFELELDIMTHHLANSGVYFHTQFQETGWPEKGNEIQINNTHIGGGDYRELKKSGSMYGTRNVYKAIATDSTWYHMHIRVNGKHLQVWIDDIQTVDYTEPKNPLESGITENHLMTSGTFALQGHDPGSKVFFKNIRVKKLPDQVKQIQKSPLLGEWEQKVLTYQLQHFAFVDLNVPSDTSMDLAEAVNESHRTGINLGFVADAEHFGPEEMARWHASVDPYPVFKGLKTIEAGQTEGVSVDILNLFDYVVVEMEIYPELYSDDPEEFMDAHVDQLIEDFDLNGFNIWTKATQLPPAFADQYDDLWTRDRISRVVKAIQISGAAIEIDNRAKLPSIAFLQMAKEQGCLFTASGIRTEEVAQGSQYIFEVIDACGLNYKDFYIPGAVLD